MQHRSSFTHTDRACSRNLTWLRSDVNYDEVESEFLLMMTQIDMIEWLQLNDNLCCLVRSMLFQFHCTQTSWFFEHSSLFALLHHCLEWLNNVSEALSLVVPITTAVHNRDGPRYTLFSEPISLRLSILLWQKLHGPVKSRLSFLLVSLKPMSLPCPESLISLCGLSTT